MGQDRENGAGALMSQEHMGRVFLQREINQNRRRELLLIPKALLALGLVAALVYVRQVFFL
jgi:hypothetical protein